MNLKKCPFCGGKVIHVRGVAEKWVSCTCGASGPIKKTVKEAKKKWNNRAEPPELDAFMHHRSEYQGRRDRAKAGGNMGGYFAAVNVIYGMNLALLTIEGPTAYAKMNPEDADRGAQENNP